MDSESDVRGVGPESAQGARDWNEYTWRGDQAPGTPFATGLQASDMDFNDLRFTKFVLQIGKQASLSDTPQLRSQYMFDDRGSDDFVRVTWDEAYRYIALGMQAVAMTYSGDDGKRRLLADGYDPVMLTHWNGAGTRTIKLGSNLPLHGLIGKFGIYRMANMLSLLDAEVADAIALIVGQALHAVAGTRAEVLLPIVRDDLLRAESTYLKPLSRLAPTSEPAPTPTTRRLTRAQEWYIGQAQP